LKSSKLRSCLIDDENVETLFDADAPTIGTDLSRINERTGSESYRPTDDDGIMIIIVQHQLYYRFFVKQCTHPRSIII
jgi:hypothetical protein